MNALIRRGTCAYVKTFLPRSETKEVMEQADRSTLVVLAFREAGDQLVPDEPIHIDDYEKARRIAAFVARKRAGVVVYTIVNEDGREDLRVFLRYGRLPTSIDAARIAAE